MSVAGVWAPTPDIHPPTLDIPSPYPWNTQPSPLEGTWYQRYPPSPPLWTHKHPWKHYFPATSLGPVEICFTLNNGNWRFSITVWRALVWGVSSTLYSRLIDRSITATLYALREHKEKHCQTSQYLNIRPLICDQQILLRVMFSQTRQNEGQYTFQVKYVAWLTSG